MVDQLPADAIGIKIHDHRRRSRCHGSAFKAPGDACHILQRATIAKGPDEVSGRLLAFAPHDGGNMGFGLKNLAPVISRVNTAIDDFCHRHPRVDAPCKRLDHRMTGGRSGMPEHDDVRRHAEGFGNDLLRGHGAEFGIKQRNVVAIVDQRAANG